MASFNKTLKMSLSFYSHRISFYFLERAVRIICLSQSVGVRVADSLIVSKETSNGNWHICLLGFHF